MSTSPPPPSTSSLTTIGSLWTAFQQGFTQLLLVEAPRAWREPTQNHYRIEREKILRHLQPFGMGIFVTIFCFATFRVSGGRWWTAIRLKYFGDFRHNNIKNNSNHKNNNNNNTYLEQANSQKQETIAQLMQMPLDLTLSAVLGSLAFLTLHDSEKMQDDLVQCPLLPGKSLMHQCLCPKIVPALQAYQQAHGPKDEQRLKYAETEKVFASFAENCQARSQYLQGRQARGLAHPDLVPYPGLRPVSSSATV